MGGVAKGQIVREIDAIGGFSGIVSDLSMIQFRMLNRSKGPAMWSPRAQCDRSLFTLEWRKILEGIENGTMAARESWNLLREADPTLVYFLITWLRARYTHDPAADAVTGRIVTLFRAHPELKRVMKEGEDDPLVEWFEDGFSYGELGAADFVRIVVEKLEG